MVVFSQCGPKGWGKLLALALAWPVLGALQPVGAATVFSYLSSPYSWVGLGETVSVAPEDGFAITATSTGNGLSFGINDFASNPDGQAVRWWYLDFATANDQPLTVGSYTGATRYPLNAYPFTDPATPGLSFIGNGRGNNALSGFFDVLETNVADDGTVLSFAADFVQYDEGNLNGWNKGAIRFHSDLPVALTPEPIQEEPILEEPVVETPIIEEPPADVELSPCYVSWNFGGSCPETDNIVEDWPIPLEQPLDLDSDIVWMFSGGSTMGNIYAPDLYPIMMSPASPSGSPTAAPGPLPAAAALAGWQSSRRLRRRCIHRP